MTMQARQSISAAARDAARGPARATALGAGLGTALGTALGAALLAVACQAPSASSSIQPGEHFAEVTLEFES